jgi:hypothetical protein
LGTLLYAVSIGPIAQLSIARFAQPEVRA